MNDGPPAPAGPAATPYWSDIARGWAMLGPPLRPAPEDVAVYEREVAAWAGRHGPPRALILGVTPELCRLPWTAGARVVAVDRTRAMIEAVWPGLRSAVVCGDWTALPFRSGSRDVALCDGGFHLTTHPDGQARFAAELRRVLAPGGLCVLRLFVPPAERESADDVFADVRARRVGSVDELKLRLAVALQHDAAEGVRLARVWNTVDRCAPDRERLAGLLGQPAARVLAIEAYRDSPARYHFLGLDGVRRMLCGEPGGFEEAGVHVPSYPLGERCPILVLRRSLEA
jgi:SAM-dependent methyltransferase